MADKYELTNQAVNFFGTVVYRIRALKDFKDVKKGDLGGYIQSYRNLSHEGNCWIYDDARVMDNAIVKDDAVVRNHAEVRDNAMVSDKARILNNTIVLGNAKVQGRARLLDRAIAEGNATVQDCTIIQRYAIVRGASLIKDSAVVSDNARVDGNVIVCKNANITSHAYLKGNIVIKDSNDYVVFKNTWSSGRYFTYTRSNKMWVVGCFYGTSQELIKKAYKDSKLSGDMYSLYVRLVDDMEKVRSENEIC